MNLQDINKTMITSSDFGAAVSLTFDESNQFIDYLVDQSFLKGNARVERMNKATKKINKVGLGSRILKPAVAGVDPGNTVGITTSQVVLSAKEVIAIAEISDDSLEDNQEGDAFVDHLMKMIAKQAGNELEAAFTYGRAITPITNAVIIDQMFDGWVNLAKANGHVVDGNVGFTDRYVGVDKLSKLVKALPTKYRQDRSALRMVLASDIHQDYIDLLGNKYTSLGDAANQNLIEVKYGSIPLAPAGLFPTTLPIIVAAGGASTVSGAHAPGVNVLNVADGANYAVNDHIAIGYGTAVEEVRKITNVSVNALTLDSATSFAHANGEACYEVTSDASDILLTDYRNMIFGIHRDIRIETQRWARTRSTSFVLTMRCDVQIENADAMAVIKNLKVK